ncbi:putative toxin-antitoxin system toxin component, PIN family [Derxia gummosa]|uniref:Toxin-antitoxin system toxin component, PIN family n=1 Tax=Derxia gummosa DSM 723 TaxID=1121388 RepID=A0A9U5FYW6_9BURK|nr:putative toxin-antitoxin system toxin component, PIN family [Derxia gummosa]
MSAAPPRLVLDTNVWLDLFVFADARCAAIAAALAEGRVQVPISRRCLDELRAVVDYPKWDGLIADRPAVVARVAAATELVEVAPDPSLPRCRDRDDQKFIELAVASGARWLVSKDKAVLKLARRLRQRGCEVLRPEQWPGTDGPPA